MPVRISSLPWHIQANLIEKVDTRALISFMKSSQVANNSAKCRKTTATVPGDLGDRVLFKFVNGEIQVSFYHLDGADRLGIRITKTILLSQLEGFRLVSFVIAIESELNDDFCRGLISFFRRSGSRTSNFRLQNEAVSCSAELFTTLLDVTKAKTLEAEQRYISPEYLKNIPENIEEISAISSLNDEDLMNSNAVQIELNATEISSAGINAYLKECCELERAVEYLFINTEKNIVKETILRGLDYLPTDEPEAYQIPIDETFMKLRICPINGHVEAEWIERHC